MLPKSKMGNNLDNLEDLSLRELRDLRSKVDRMISSYEDRKRREAVAAAEEAAREYGFSLAELTGNKRRGGIVAPKYANPSDPSMTWTGRGRRPLWVQDQLNQGKTLEDIAI